MKAIIPLLVAALASSAAYADPRQGSATTTVSRLMDALQRRDEASFAEVAPELMFMAAPDFGMRFNWNDALSTIGQCSLQSLSEPRPLDNAPYSIVTATMTCPAPLPPGPQTIGFMADESHVLVFYRGDMDPFSQQHRVGDGVQH